MHKKHKEEKPHPMLHGHLEKMEMPKPNKKKMKKSSAKTMMGLREKEGHLKHKR